MSDRYLLDPLYGKVHHPSYIWEAARAPELQRLREVRMCNINSLTLTGAGAVHRFEHSFGTAYLAQVCAAAWSHNITPDDEKTFILAALLHDVGSAGFGHSVEYVLDAEGYRHEALDEIVADRMDETGFQYRSAALEPIFFGARRALPRILGATRINAVSRLMQGEGMMGPLISGSVDLDNVDNVYRLAFHMGLSTPNDSPLRLARSMMSDEDGLIVDDDAVDTLEDWRRTRGRLYDYLLLNADEFAAKCMLERALWHAKRVSSTAFKWHDVDYSVMKKLAVLSPQTNTLVSRIMLGELFGCIGIYDAQDLSLASVLAEPINRQRFEASITDRIRKLMKVGLKPTVALHVIADVNKTQREVTFRTTSGRTVRMGRGSRRLLIGAFLTNSTLSVNQLDRDQLRKHGVQAEVRAALQEVSELPVLEHETYGEGNVS